MEIKNNLAVGDTAFIMENNRIRKLQVVRIKIDIDSSGQVISYMLTDESWHKQCECFAFVESLLTYLSNHVVTRSMKPF